MINKIKQYISKYNMLEKGDQIIVGVSGGADSVCLFHVLTELSESYGLTLFVIHVNHGIRGEEADRDEEFVRSLCKERGVSFTAVCKDIPFMAKAQGLSLEEAGRITRYEVFNQYLNAYKCNKIAIAHNKNDNAETILFNLFRGSALTGLTGINPVRDNIIRPLLCLERQEIEAYLSNRSAGYLDDSTNFTLDYTRNKIRHGILKNAAEVNKQAISHISRAGDSLMEVGAFVEKMTLKAMERVLVRGDNVRRNLPKKDVYSSDNNTEIKEAALQGKVQLLTEELIKEDIVIQKELVRKALSFLSGSLKDLEAVHVTAVLDLVSKQTGKRVNLPYGITAVKEYNHISFVKDKKNSSCIDTSPPENELVQELNIPGRTPLPDREISLITEVMNYKKNMIIPQNLYTKWFDYDKIKDTVLIRRRKQGDYLCIDARGSTKKLKAYFIDEKVPRQIRDVQPLLADGSHIVWVIGGRISEAYKVDENTKRILQIKLTEEKENE
ncbi:tRNA lysidine(34) synthetase TilS [Anaerocolumna sp. AGMB13020]|uniref:tRNA lysidine(34) synthetase TilS n=1 Tax=Anaerocolumna sp. AGMB13020 TaxID=3081750 RepID=UPI002955840D|nr:tRNA lysidine(34) synthetase TilS [Anaerocolumna sp. AGMB13020]WOO34780.1 tRNA lysidine(34) synthetase TilS [Anaerocolumna sp. AGMB13020]